MSGSYDNILFNKVMYRVFLLFICLQRTCTQDSTTNQRPNKPHIVFIVADNLGWDDVSFHGSPQIPTPNIDSLALSGVILNSYYVSPSPLASKAEFMTGKYATKLGIQHGVLHNKQPFGLPEQEKILPQYLNELGYESHAIGKWGLGFFDEKMLPWKRGFKSFYGGLTSGSVDYFTHSAYEDDYGLDLRRNDQPIQNETGNYVTELYTKEAVNLINNHDQSKPLFLYVSHQAVHSGNIDDPLQVPDRYLQKVQHIRDHKRRLYAGMVTALDESIYNITSALADKGYLENTVIVFTTDSGGAVGGMELNAASNFPLRGSKLTVWEGGIRGVSFVYSDLIFDKSRVIDEMFHSTDWLPTILWLAGEDVRRLPLIDGFNIWNAIANQSTISPRFEILHQFDPLQKNLCAIRVGDYKVIFNQDIGFYGDWYPRTAEVGELQNLPRPITSPNAQVKCDKNYPHPFLEMHAPPCDSMKKPCLFNIQWDPCEFHNLAEFMPNTLRVLIDRLHYFRQKIKSPVYPKFDPASDPEENDGVWGPWVNVNRNRNSNTVSPTASPTANVSSNLIYESKSYEPVTESNQMISSISTQPAPVVLTEKAISEVPKWEKELSSNKTSQNIYSTPLPITIETTPSTLSEGKNIPPNDEKDVNQFLNVVSDNGDNVVITVNNKNVSKNKEHDYAHIGDDFVNAGEGNSTLNLAATTSNVIVTSNKTAENPSQTTAFVNDLHVNKGGVTDTSSISDDTLSYSHSKESSTHSEHGVVYASGPLFKNESTEAKAVLNETQQTYPLWYNVSQNQDNLNSINNTTESPENGAAQVTQQLPPPPPVALQPPAPPSPVASEKQSESTLLKEQGQAEEPKVALPPAMYHPPSGASLRPEGQKKPPSSNSPAGGGKGLHMGSDSETISSSESEVGANTLTDVKTESKLPALQNAKVLATLNNVADAGDKNKSPGKQGLSSEVGLASGIDLKPGDIAAQNFIKEPKYAQVEKPTFEKPQNPFANLGTAGEKQAQGSSAGAGSETESETVVGAGAQIGSDTKIKQGNDKNGPKLAPGQITPEVESKEAAVAKETTEDIPVVPVESIPKAEKVDSFIKPNKPGIGSSLKALSSHAAANDGAEFSLANSHLNVPNIVVAGHRPFQSVTDVVSDAPLVKECGEGRSCVLRPSTSPQIQPSNMTSNKGPLQFANVKEIESTHKYHSITVGGTSTNQTQGPEATSNEYNSQQHLGNDTKTNEGNLPSEPSAEEKLHKFFGQIKVDNKKLFYIAGAASEDKDLVYPPSDTSGLVTQNDVRKHNIGFNVMLPINVVKQVVAPPVAQPKFKEHSKFKNTTLKTNSKKVHFLNDKIHNKNKTSIKKVFDMIADPARTRKTKVEIPPVLEEHEITSKTNIATVTTTEDDRGDAGDIGATKPLRGTLVESKPSEIMKSTISNDTGSDNKVSSDTEAGDLGSIVTLVGKVRVDRLNSKRLKHNVTSDENTAHKKTVKGHSVVKHTQRNASETNAANIDQIQGPSNSIIVSSVIVVLIASFVVVGMAVVAIVAVVARHCEIGKRLAAS